MNTDAASVGSCRSGGDSPWLVEDACEEELCPRKWDSFTRPRKHQNELLEPIVAGGVTCAGGAGAPGLLAGRHALLPLSPFLAHAQLVGLPACQPRRRCAAQNLRCL